MILWAVLTVMCCAACVAVSVPLIRRFEGGTAARGASFQIYEEQLREIDRDIAQGTIGEKEGELARIEVQRRMLAVSRREETLRPLSPEWRGLALMVTVAFVSIFAVVTYLQLGQPTLQSLPPSPSATNATQVPSKDASGSPGQVDALVFNLEQRLISNPKDAEGWRMLGWSYFNMQRFDDSVTAYAKALALDPGNQDYAAAYGEALVQASRGLVTPEAGKIFADVLAKDPKDERSRFYDALAREQAGDQTGALDRWIALLGDAPANAGWRADVLNHIADLGKATGRDVSNLLSSAPAASSGDLPLGNGNRDAVIDTMIQNLAVKLRANPRDRDGWAMMIRSLKSSGDKIGAEKALAEALQIFKDDPETMQGLKNIAQSSGQGSSELSIDPDQAAAITALPAEDQQTMILAMVDRLQAQLQSRPRDAEGWIRLMRSRMVLKQDELAAAALHQALTVFADDAGIRQSLTDAAAGLGISAR